MFVTTPAVVALNPYTVFGATLITAVTAGIFVQMTIIVALVVSFVATRTLTLLYNGVHVDVPVFTETAVDAADRARGNAAGVYVFVPIWSGFEYTVVFGASGPVGRA